MNEEAPKSLEVQYQKVLESIIGLTFLISKIVKEKITRPNSFIKDYEDFKNSKDIRYALSEMNEAFKILRIRARGLGIPLKTMTPENLKREYDEFIKETNKKNH